MIFRLTRLLSLLSISLVLAYLSTSAWVWSRQEKEKQADATAQTAALAPLGPDENGKYWIRSAELSAGFIAYGASVTNLLVRDRHGVDRDVIVGYDNATAYAADAAHPHLGGVPGRYANRIRNSSFVLDGVRYHLLPNEHPDASHPDGTDTLHGGPGGWDWREWAVVAHDPASITFSLVDPAGSQGFPGSVVAYATYALVGAAWEIKMVAVPTTVGVGTPIMMTSHAYWNLDGFANAETRTALQHRLWLPHAGQRVAVDGALVPTGDILANEPRGVNDFWTAPKALGTDLKNPDLKDNCGTGCVGYDTCYLINRGVLDVLGWRDSGPVARLHSPWSGIQLDIYTDQAAFQLYSCNGQDDTMPLKTTQGPADRPDNHDKPDMPDYPQRTVPQYGCVVMEVQDWIDGINHPEWGRADRQVFEPGGDPYVLQASYRFSINKTTDY